VTSGDWIGLGGLVFAAGGTMVTAVGWLVKVQTREHVTKKEMDDALAKVEARIRERVDQLDQHVQTIEAMWVAKGRD
jgi:hypothetical protein